MSNAIMIALGKAKPSKRMKEENDMEEEEELPSPDVDEDLVAAAEEVRSAKTAEEYAVALKAFVELVELSKEE